MLKLFDYLGKNGGGVNNTTIRFYGSTISVYEDISYVNGLFTLVP